MTRSKLFDGIITCLVLLFGGCVHTGSPQPITVVVQGDPATTAKIAQILKENPKIVVPGTQTEYSIGVVETDPNVDYKIGQVNPDPTVDYKIGVINPKSGNEIPDLSRQLGNVIQEKLNQEKELGAQNLYMAFACQGKNYSIRSESSHFSHPSSDRSS